MFILLTLYVFICVALILIVLLQPGREESLGTLLGGSTAQNLFGSRTTTVLTKITAVLAVLFMASAVIIAGILDHRASGTKTLDGLQEEVQAQQSQMAVAPTPLAETILPTASGAETPMPVVAPPSDPTAVPATP